MLPRRAMKVSSASSTTRASGPASRRSRARTVGGTSSVAAHRARAEPDRSVMELILTDEQRILRESAAKLVAECAARRRSDVSRGAPAAFDRDVWVKVAHAGWLAILVPETHGGLGLGITELCLVAEAKGRALVLEPVGAVAVAAGAIAAGHDGALPQALLPRLVGGEHVVVPVLEGGAAVPHWPP